MYCWKQHVFIFLNMYLSIFCIKVKIFYFIQVEQTLLLVTLPLPAIDLKQYKNCDLKKKLNLWKLLASLKVNLNLIYSNFFHVLIFHLCFRYIDPLLDRTVQSCKLHNTKYQHLTNFINLSYASNTFNWSYNARNVSATGAFS